MRCSINVSVPKIIVLGIGNCKHKMKNIRHLKQKNVARGTSGDEFFANRHHSSIW